GGAGHRRGPVRGTVPLQRAVREGAGAGRVGRDDRAAPRRARRHEAGRGPTVDAGARGGGRLDPARAAGPGDAACHRHAPSGAAVARASRAPGGRPLRWQLTRARTSLALTPCTLAASFAGRLQAARSKVIPIDFAARRRARLETLSAVDAGRFGDARRALAGARDFVLFWRPPSRRTAAEYLGGRWDWGWTLFVWTSE